MSSPPYPQWPVLIVDDEAHAVQGCEFTLRAAGVNHVLGLADSREVMPLLEQRDAAAILLDLSMPHLGGCELLAILRERRPEIPVIILTGANDVETAVACMKAGAFDYMVKPTEENRLVSGVRRAVELRELRREYDDFRHRVLTNELESPRAFKDIVTQSPAMRSVFQYLETVAPTPWPVLITGETGVGKDLAARALHQLSKRAGAFVPVNVAGLDDNVFADTLFGHLKGAFTGAEESRQGLVERAAGGTLFLDEIGELSPTSQLKLLHLLQDQKYLPIGADMPKRAEARVIVATNTEFKTLRDGGAFRADLFYRLQTHHVHLPPLRERLEDIPLLVDHFLEQAAQALDKKRPTPPKELYTLLAMYHFPGNVRELQAMVYDAVSRHKARILSMDLFKAHIEAHRAALTAGVKKLL